MYDEELLRAGRSACDELRAKALAAGNTHERRKLERLLEETSAQVVTLDRQVAELRSAIRDQQHTLASARELCHPEVVH